MESYAAGWLSILPPIVAIVLALLTKEVFSSLLLGIFSGTLIYSLGTHSEHVFIQTLETTFTLMEKKVDFQILLFCTLLGALVYVLNLAGGTRAYGRWATRKIKNRRAAMLSTSGLGVFIFIDDYFNALTVGAVMKPVTDAYRISREKLAYIIDSTAAPICIIAPVSSWAAAVGSSLKSTGAFESDFAAFVATIPYNFYALLCLFLVGYLCYTGRDFGPMRQAEMKACSLDKPLQDFPKDHQETQATLWDMLLPILALIVFAVLGLLYDGGYWGQDVQFHSAGAALGNCSAPKALVWASFGALVVAFLLFIPRRLVKFNDFMSGSIEGMKTMLPANIILVLAWTLSGVCRDLLQTPLFIQDLVQGGGALDVLLPAAVFIIAGFLSFSTGTAWGTFGILIPIVVPLTLGVDPSLVVVTLSATLAGAVFGDHCSPISDTTILSSAGAGCDHIRHVTTQMPYAWTIALCSIVGYVVAGLTHANLFMSFGAALLSLIAILLILKIRQGKKSCCASEKTC